MKTRESSFAPVAVRPADANTPLLGVTAERMKRFDTTRTKHLATKYGALALVACVGAAAAFGGSGHDTSSIAAAMASPELSSPKAPRFARGPSCNGVCPSVAARDFDAYPEEGSAHVLMLGDSTDRAWHFTFCNGILNDADRCEHPVECVAPTVNFLPNNMQPLVCADGDKRCAAKSCYEDAPCWHEKENEMAAACHPTSPYGPALGFVHLFEPDPESKQDLKLVEYGREIDGLPVMTGPRVNAAVRSFDKFAPAEKADGDGHHATDHDAKKRPVVVVVDVMHWWVGNHLGWGAPGAPPDWSAELGSDRTFDANLRRYRKDLDALVEHVDKAMKGTGRPYRLVGKANHDWHTFKPDGVEHRFLSAMAAHVKRAFESKKHHFFDWRALTEKAKSDNMWEMADNFHQTVEGSKHETLAFMDWTRTALPEKFAVNLDVQFAKQAEEEEARRSAEETERKAREAKEEKERKEREAREAKEAKATLQDNLADAQKMADNIESFLTMQREKLFKETGVLR